MEAEERVAEAIRRCLSGKEGEIVLDWLVSVANDNYPVTVVGEHGTDPVYAAFKDGGAEMARTILHFANCRITFERKPDAGRTKHIPDGYDTDGAD